MLGAISHYIKNIAVFLVFVSFVGIILPNTKYKNYINIVMGFILIFIMLEPVTRLLYGKDNPMDSVMLNMELELEKNIVNNESQYYDDMKNQMIMENFNVLIKQQVENILEQEGYRVSDFQLTCIENTGEIQTLVLTVSKETVEPTAKPFVRIESVKIETSKRKENPTAAIGEEDPEIKNVKNKISDFYNLSKDNIHVNIQKNE